MTLTHTGSTKKYSANWENIFGGGKKKSPNGAKPAPKKKATVKAKKRKS